MIENMQTIHKFIKDLDLSTGEFTFRDIKQLTLSSVQIAIGINGDFFMLYAEDEETAIKLGLVEDLRSGMYVTEDLLGNLFPRKWEPFNSSKYFEKQVLPNFPKTTAISEGKDYTFGIELETFGGYVPVYSRSKLGISAHYDGSILDERGNKNAGAEYVTDVLRYDAGFRHLQDITFEIARRCVINKTCSIHVHLGNMDFNKEFIFLAYKLGYIIQDEVLEMMPLSRRENEYCQKVSGKCLKYNVKPYVSNGSFKNVKGLKKEVLHNILSELYSSIVEEISVGHRPSVKINKKLNHPHGRFCGYNRRTPRYWWLNFLPSLFTIEEGRKHTLEFRAHSATLNYEKIKNWILICMGIVSFIENNKEDIYAAESKPGSISLNYLMHSVYPKKGDYLVRYINKRKALFNDNCSVAEVEEYNYYKNINEEKRCLNLM